MKLKKNRKTILVVGIIASFALLLVSVSLYFSYRQEIQQQGRLTPEMIESFSNEELISYISERRSEEPIFSSYYLIPFAGFMGLITGTVIYYMLSEKIDAQNNALEKNARVILNFLSSPEKKVVEILLENEGKIPQYELSHLPGLNKVKTHRILNHLEQKGVISRERFGKINRITLNNELYDVLK